MMSKPVQKTPFWYQVLLAIIVPLYRIRVWQRSKLQADYQQEVIERFMVSPLGKNQEPKNINVIWIHAVSVGETNAAQPIIEHFLARGQAVLVTNTTRTGQARAKSLFARSYPDLFEAVFLPVDTIGLIRLFLQRYQPRLFILIETELWPNALNLTAQANIPSILINARLSERSAKGYAKFSRLTHPMLQQLSCIAAQDADTAQRFIELGADAKKVVVTGSVKFDIKPPIHLLQQAKQIQNEWQLINGVGRRPILVAASTHDPEEADIVAQFKTVLVQYPNAVLIVVPRHPERFASVAQLIKNNGFELFQRSQQQVIQSKTQVYLADSMGELWLWYALADMAFVGGSLSSNGGHNPLEPVALGVPVVMGEHTFNFQAIVEQLMQAHALTQVDNAEQLMQVWLNWLQHPDQTKQAGVAGLQVMQANQGALEKQIGLINKLLDKTWENIF